jgi:hypothetical protein
MVSRKFFTALIVIPLALIFIISRWPTVTS